VENWFGFSKSAGIRALRCVTFKTSVGNKPFTMLHTVIKVVKHCIGFLKSVGIRTLSFVAFETSAGKEISRCYRSWL